MIVETYQNEKEPIKMKPHEHEQIKETEERNAKNRIWIGENPRECETLKEVLLKNWGIKK